jgi:cytochrome c peroxidase
MGSLGAYDRQNNWDSPTLVEIWRTGPYMHDGRCASLEEVFTRELHGLSEPLPEKQLKQLLAFVLSL